MDRWRWGNRKGLSFISNRQRRKEGTFCASELAGIEPTPPAPKGAGYVRLDHSATVGTCACGCRRAVMTRHGGPAPAAACPRLVQCRRHANRAGGHRLGRWDGWGGRAWGNGTWRAGRRRARQAQAAREQGWVDEVRQGRAVMAMGRCCHRRPGGAREAGRALMRTARTG